MMYRARCRRFGSANALTMTSGPMPAGSPRVIAMVGLYSILPLMKIFGLLPVLFKPIHDRFGQDVRFEIARPPDRPAADRCQCYRRRDQCYIKPRAIDRSDREADPIQRHRSLG